MEARARIGWTDLRKPFSQMMSDCDHKEDTKCCGHWVCLSSVSEGSVMEILLGSLTDCRALDVSGLDQQIKSFLWSLLNWKNTWGSGVMRPESDCSFQDVWEVLWLDWQVLGQHQCLKHLGKRWWGKNQHHGTWSSQCVTPPWLPVTEPSLCCSVRAVQWERAAWWVREVWWAHCDRS